jgi:TolB-like protein/DNA-binding winged helix-turn-helix (wHTH) protein
MASEILRFEDFELDRGAYELRRAGRVVRLERIPLDLLFMLVERHGQLVTRQEILDRIWGKDVFVDVDNSINTAVRKIRQALKDNPENPRLLHTVPSKGYRFGGNVVEAGNTKTAGSAIPVPAAAEVPTAASKPRHWPYWLGLAAAVAAVLFMARPYLLRTPKPVSNKVMLVVLPFENLSGDPGQDYFADGMTEEMITRLGSLDPQHLGVIARTSAMQYKAAHKSMAQIAQELGVQYLLEGSVRRASNQVRVTAQLIQSSDQTHLWADSYDRDLRDVLKLQSEVARTIASKIQLTLSEQFEARLAGTQTVNPEAHEAYLLGLQAWNLRTRDGFQRSIAEFNRAITIDPNYAPAYAGLARAYSLVSISGGVPPLEAMPKAREAAQRSIALDDSLAEGHTVLAFVKAHFEHDWPVAEQEYIRALELNPSDAFAHFFYSNSYLSPLGRHEEAIAEMKQAIELDPFSAPVQSFLGRTFLWARRYDEALTQLRKCDALFPEFVINHERLAHLSTYAGRFEEAIAEETKARLLGGEDPRAVAMKEEALRRALADGGPYGYWEKVLEFSQMKENPPEAYATAYGVAIIYARLDEKKKAIDSLEGAYARRELAMTEIGIEPAFDGLRPDPRFTELLRKVGLAH